MIGYWLQQIAARGNRLDACMHGAMVELNEKIHVCIHGHGLDSFMHGGVLLALVFLWNKRLLINVIHSFIHFIMLSSWTELLYYYR